MKTIDSGSVQVAIKNGIATIEFYHPASNSLPGNLLAKLAASIEDSGKNAAIRVIVLKSAGDRTFCAGASFDELVSISNELEGSHFFSGFAKLVSAMRKCPKLIIGRIQGKAVGGGVGIAAATDISYATNHAMVKLSELSIGIGPFVVGPIVQRKMGLPAFSQLTLEATKWQSADWAKRNGLYADVFENISKLDGAVQELSTTLARSNPEAMSMLKKIFWEGTDHWDLLMQDRAKMSGKLVLSEFTSDAIKQFKKQH